MPRKAKFAGLFLYKRGSIGFVTIIIDPGLRGPRTTKEKIDKIFTVWEKTKNRKAVRILFKASQTRNETRREQALNCLGSIVQTDWRSAWDVFSEMLDAPERSRYAAFLLAIFKVIDKPEVIEKLRKLSESSDAKFRDIGIRGLKIAENLEEYLR